MRYLVAYLDEPVEAENAKQAVEKAAQAREILECGHTWFAVPLDAVGIETFRIGAEQFVIPAQLRPEQA